MTCESYGRPSFCVSTVCRINFFLYQFNFSVFPPLVQPSLSGRCHWDLECTVGQCHLSIIHRLVFVSSQNFVFLLRCFCGLQFVWLPLFFCKNLETGLNREFWDSQGKSESREESMDSSGQRKSVIFTAIINKIISLAWEVPVTSIACV